MISDALGDEPACRTGRLLAFRNEPSCRTGRRDWEHPPDDGLLTLSTSIALEVAELMEHTQWAKDADLPTLATEHRDALSEELADIAILLTYLAHDLRVNLETAVRQKLVRNASKYPVEKAKGVPTKYDRL